jgi:aquaporin Z
MSPGTGIAQVVGGAATGALTYAVVNPASVRTLALPGHAEAAAAVMEVLFTFAQCYVVLNVATSKDRPDNGSSAWRSDSPWRSALRRRGISGCMFNPAVALGGATGGLFVWSAMWVHPRPARRRHQGRAGVPRAQPRRQVARDQSRKESSI